MSDRGPRDFCKEEGCGAALDDRDSYWGNCFAHREKMRANCMESINGILDNLASGKPLVAPPPSPFSRYCEEAARRSIMDSPAPFNPKGIIPRD